MSPEPETADTEAKAPPDIETGRYLYCAVLIDDDSEAIEIEKPGIEGEDVAVESVGSVGIVYHVCDGLYDSGDITQVKRWLVRHQSIVDAAGEAFGTPIPFQFDTIIRGGDERLREWLRDEQKTLERSLEELSGHWEYRIEVVETEPIEGAQLRDRDDRLTELYERIEASESGTAHLLEKQYEQRLKGLRADRRDTIEDDLCERLESHAREIHVLDRTPGVTLNDGIDTSAGGDETAVASGETVCRFTILADEDDETAIGSVLDDVASNPDLAVTYTGPWPPYTFAPELGEST